MEYSGKTLICNVLFLDIVGYSKKSVVEQISVKERFNAYLMKAIQGVPIEDRIILDTGDGAAINFLGDVENALQVALNMQKLLRQDELKEPSLKIRMGINLGPVRLIRDINGRPNIIGDGINSSQRVMGFANPGQILVSRPYYEAMSNLSSKYTRLFHFQGARTDKHHVREYEVYGIAHPGEWALGGTRTIIRNPKTIGLMLVLLAWVWVARPALTPFFERPPPSTPAVAPLVSGVAPAPAPGQAGSTPAVAVPARASAPPAPAVSSAAVTVAPAVGADTNARVQANQNAMHAGQAMLKIDCAKGTLVLIDNLPRGKITKSERMLWLGQGKHSVMLVYPPKSVSYTQDVVLRSGHIVTISPRAFCTPLK